jgi:predicted nucleotidyltransferase
MLSVLFHGGDKGIGKESGAKRGNVIMAGKVNVDLKIIKNMAESIKTKFNPQKIILFGSYAYGKPDRKSDIDFLVIMDTVLSVKEQAFLIRRELRTTIPVDVIVRTPQQIKERIELNDFFIKRIMERGIHL